MSELVTLPVAEGPHGVRLAVPPGWETVAVEEDLLVLAVADWSEAAGFRPNLTVVVTPVSPATADVRGLGAVAVAGARSEHVGAHVVSYDLRPGPEGVEGRCLRFAYPYPAGSVAVTQWLFVHGGLAFTVTGSADVSALETVRPYLDAAVEGLRLPPASTSDVLPLPVPFDPFMAELGEELEDLAAFGRPEPYRPLGPLLKHSALAALVRAHSSGARLRGLSQQTRDDLVAAELIGREGALTPAGRRIARLLAAPSGRVRIEANADAVPLSIESFLGEGVALTVSTPSPDEVRDRPPLSGSEVERVASYVRLDLTEPGHLPLALAAWLGIGPTWSVRGVPEDLPLGLVTARGDDPAAPPPPGADASLLDLWRRAWFTWTFVTSASGPGLVVVDAGSRGQFAITHGAGGQVGLRAFPSAAVWNALVSGVAGVVRGTR